MPSISPTQSVPLTAVVQPVSGAGAARPSPKDMGQVAASQTIQGAVVDTGGAAAGTSSSPSPGADELKKLVADMQSKLSGANANLEFSVDAGSGRSVVTVTERTTNEVIWQFPSEEALQVSKELGRYSRFSNPP